MIKANDVSMLSSSAVGDRDRLQKWSCGCRVIDDACILRPGRVTMAFSRNRRVSTSLAIEVALRAVFGGCARSGVLVLSPMLSAPEYFSKMACVIAGINRWHVKVGLLKEERVEVDRRFKEAASRLSAASILVEDTPIIDPEGLMASVKKVDPEFNLGLVIVDCLQDYGYVIGGPAGWSSLGCRLKRIAVDNNVPVLILFRTSSVNIKMPDVFDGYGCLQDYVDISLGISWLRNNEDGTREYSLRRLGVEDRISPLVIRLDPMTESIKDIRKQDPSPASFC